MTSRDVVSGRLPATPVDLQQPLPVGQADRPISVSRSCVKPPQHRIACMDDCCRDADRCVWDCGGRYYVPGADDAD